MGKIGAKYPCFAPIASEPSGALPTYSAGVSIGKLVSANVTVNLSSGEQYADDELAEQVSDFLSATIAMETNDMTDSVAEVVYGAAVTNGELIDSAGDVCPLGGLGYYKTMILDGAKKFQAFFYPKARAALGNDSAQTRGSSVTFQNTSTTFTVFQPKNGAWRIRETFSTEAAAIAWIKSKLSISTQYRVDVQVQGASGSEGVDPVGVTYGASGENVALTITGTATALYDNGVESKASIAGGVYTISAIAADHVISVIF